MLAREQRGKCTRFRIDHLCARTPDLGKAWEEVPPVQPYSGPLDIDIKERRLIKDECDRLDLPIMSICCVAVGIACVAVSALGALLHAPLSVHAPRPPVR